MFKKRGQAALEFLMTYGWAILAAIIAIGVLVAIFGFGGGLGGSNAALSPPFIVNAHKVDTAGVSLEIKNSGTESLTITSITAGICDSGILTQEIIASGQYLFTISCTLVEKDSFRQDIIVKYTKAGSSLEQVATGSINSKVVPAP